MGYLHIENLYRNLGILNFKRCYALEKVHGTSAHISFKRKPCAECVMESHPEVEAHGVELIFFSGGEKHERFVALFDQDALKAAFAGISTGINEMIVYGEAYGGKMQGMAHTYGPDLRFIAFDVQVGETWVSVPNMANIATKLGLEVVPWEETSTELDALNALRDRPSEVAMRRGCGADKQREGIVLRPLDELTDNRGNRIIAKHKIDKFGERKSQPKVHNVDQHKLDVLTQAREIAEEWVVDERLSHVIAHLTVDGVEPGIESTGKVIAAMIEDVYREAAGEIVESKEAKQAISKATAALFKARLQAVLK